MKEVRWVEQEVTVGEITNAHNVLVGKSGRKRPENGRMLWDERMWTGFKWLWIESTGWLLRRR
jgi:hypothetical protein